MYYSKGQNKTINHLHERAFRIFKIKNPNFKTLLHNDKSITIHVKNLHYLMTEIYKVESAISLEIMKDFFTFQENSNHNLMSGIHLASILLQET